jgi:hypothetical protein
VISIDWGGGARLASSCAETGWETSTGCVAGSPLAQAIPPFAIQITAITMTRATIIWIYFFIEILLKNV